MEVFLLDKRSKGKKNLSDMNEEYAGVFPEES